ncbi:transaldolase [Candidatus Bipolaricaulota bacterium]|nr:transaldolase [Candidatus Bipolaricaulota bacterium]
MKIFVDSAQIEEIKEAESWGILDGVTTNPSLIKAAVRDRDGIEMEEYIKEICRAVDGPVSLEVIGLDAEEMVEQARLLYERFNPVNDNVVVKIPVNTSSEESGGGSYEGLKAIKALSEEGIPTNTTLVMKPEQALMAAKAGTQYVSPFAGRIDDFIRSNVGLTRGEDYPKGDYHDSDWLQHASYLNLRPRYEELEGEELPDIYSDDQVEEAREKVKDAGIPSGAAVVSSIKRIFANYNFDTEVLAASLRNSRQVREVAEAGSDVATVPFQVMKEMVDHHKTAEGIVSFSEDVVEEYENIFG